MKKKCQVYIDERPRHLWPMDKIQYWVEVEKRTLAEIGTALGCPHQRISKLCKKHGIKTQRTGPRSGKGHPEWRGGRRIDADGYICIYKPDHPFCRNDKTVLEHRLVMEEILGRYLHPSEVVHHIDGDKQNNDIDNLQLYASNADHLRDELYRRVPEWGNSKKVRNRKKVRKERHIQKELETDDRKNISLFHRRKPLPRIKVPVVLCKKVVERWR